MTLTDGIYLSKEVTIERLIDTSIELFFTLKDSVSIHVLASSANVMLTDLLKHHGVKTLIERYIPSEKLVKWLKAERKLYNFMKHADKDPYNEVVFKEEINTGCIFLCITRFKILYKRDSQNMRLFFLTGF